MNAELSAQKLLVCHLDDQISEGLHCLHPGRQCAKFFDFCVGLLGRLKPRTGGAGLRALADGQELSETTTQNNERRERERVRNEQKKGAIEI